MDNATVTKTDFSEWLTGEKFENEEREWARHNEEGPGHRVFAEAVNTLSPKSVIEFGCGTGWTAQYLNAPHYWGVDANLRCLELASKRAPRGYFIHSDIREYIELPNYDVALCTAFLKHFGLHEWDDIFAKFMSFAGKHAVFTVQIADRDKDDGSEYHHVYITEEHLNRAITGNEHKLIARRLCAEDQFGSEWLFTTERNT